MAGRAEPAPAYPGENCKKYSTLYLLRMDAQRCYQIAPPIYWLSAIALLSGVDLLAKLYNGSDSINQGGPRFKDFVNRFMAAGDGIKMWDLRNAMMHSYGVFHTEPDPAGGSRLEKRFRLTAHGALGAPIAGASIFNVGSSSDVFELDILELRVAFDMAVADYETHIRATPSEQLSKFEPMFEKYGWIYICEKNLTVDNITIRQGASGG